MNLSKIILKESMSRAILLALLLVSLIPILVISFLFVQQSTDALTEQMEENLQNLVSSKAGEIDWQLREILDLTQIATAHTAEALQQEVAEERVTAVMNQYQPDERNILGLDIYYRENNGVQLFGDDLSNVYWNNEQLVTDDVARTIVATEQLDTIYGNIKSVSPHTQWIYMTTPEGMMRLYPWASNDHYPDSWDPTQIVFYTVANETNNPSLEPAWTAPYVDYAGAGWMVTLSIPMLDESGEMLGVMSHDVTIEVLQNFVQDIQVLDGAGYGFLIDDTGRVISHPNYQDEAAQEGEQEEVSLLNVGTSDFRGLIGQMTDGVTGLGYFQEEETENILVYAPIPVIGWSLGIVVPQAEVIAPATAMQERAVAITLLLVSLVVTLSVYLTNTFHAPLLQLLNAAHQVTEEGRADVVRMDSFKEFNTLAEAFNEMSSKVSQRERHLKAQVRQLTIEIDEQKKEEQIQSLVETDYFKRLENQVSEIRAKQNGRTQVSLD